MKRAMTLLALTIMVVTPALWGGRCVGSSGWWKLERQPRLAELFSRRPRPARHPQALSRPSTPPSRLSAARAATLRLGRRARRACSAASCSAA